MKYWPNHVFAFLLAVTKVKVNLATQYFGGLSVCRMFQLPSCMLQKQSFNTGLNSATQKHKQWHANDHH